MDEQMDGQTDRQMIEVCAWYIEYLYTERELMLFPWNESTEELTN